MKERVLAERYSKALVLLGLEEKSLERFRDELRRFSGVVKTEPKLLKILSYRELSREKRMQILDDLMLKMYLSAPVQSLFRILLKRGKMELFPFLLETFEEQVRKIENTVVAKVKVAEEKSVKPRLLELKAALEKITEKKVEMEVTEDPSLIGGLQVLLGDKIYDASVKGELKRIQEQWG